MDQLCNEHLQHAKSFIYGRFGNDAKLAPFETSGWSQCAACSGVLLRRWCCRPRAAWGLAFHGSPQDAVDARLLTSAVGPEPDMRMRGTDRPQSGMFITYRRSAEYPMSIRCVRFARWLSWCCAIWARSLKRCMRKSGGCRFRPSNCCGRCRLQVLYTVRSERMLMEQLDYNLLFRWFVGLNIPRSSPRIATGCCAPRCWRRPAQLGQRW